MDRTISGQLPKLNIDGSTPVTRYCGRTLALARRIICIYLPLASSSIAKTFACSSPPSRHR
jgi:hypothetical protein